MQPNFQAHLFKEIHGRQLSLQGVIFEYLIAVQEYVFPCGICVPFNEIEYMGQGVFVVHKFGGEEIGDTKALSLNRPTFQPLAGETHEIVDSVTKGALSSSLSASVFTIVL